VNPEDLERARRMGDAARLARRAVEAGELSPEAARWYLLGRALTHPTGGRASDAPKRRLGDPRG
jgi:hypothetical protein